MEELVIRPVRPSDAKEWHEIRLQHPESMLALSSYREDRAEEYLSHLSPESEHIFVATRKERLLGFASLHIVRSLRCRHVANVGVTVHSDCWGQGIGRALMNRLIDLADRELMLLRLELDVFTDNERAIRLYESLGFIKEGLRRSAAIKNGVYADLFHMARLRPSS